MSGAAAEAALDSEGTVAELRAHVAALEQLLEVYERTVAEQADKLEQTLVELASYSRELKRSNEELELFAYVASHDLQEPLRMVASYTQLLARRYRDRLDADGLEFVDYAVDGAQRMQSLINGLLDYSRVGTRGKPFQSVSMTEAVEAALRNLAVTVSETRSSVTVQPELPPAEGDFTQIVQLLQNLIANAVKFRGRDPARVEVYAETSGDDPPVYVVRDYGIGIEPRYAERIFLIFQRLHTADEYPGTGIGLALAKKIVERHGGWIRVESQPGAGAVFKFTLTGARPSEA